MAENNKEFIEEGFSSEDIVSVLEADEFGFDDKESLYKQTEMAITVDENGVTWYSLKKAAQIIGKSVSTVRRYAKEGHIQHKIEVSPYGEMYFLKKDEVDIIAYNQQMKVMKKSAGRADLSIEMKRFLETYESSILSPLQESISMIGETQQSIQNSIEDTKNNLDKAIEKNTQLEKTILEMKETMDEQQKKIDEQQEYIEAQKKKGFFARLFGKD